MDKYSKGTSFYVLIIVISISVCAMFAIYQNGFKGKYEIESYKRIKLEESISNYEKTEKELLAQIKVLKREIKELENENSQLNNGNKNEQKKNVGQDQSKLDVYLEFEDAVSKAETVEDVFRLCPNVIDGAYTETYGSTLYRFYIDLGASTFIDKLSRTENYYKISDITNALMSEIGIIYGNTDDIDIDVMCEDLMEVYKQKNISLRKKQIINHMLADLEVYKSWE